MFKNILFITLSTILFISIIELSSFLMLVVFNQMPDISYRQKYKLVYDHAEYANNFAGKILAPRNADGIPHPYWGYTRYEENWGKVNNYGFLGKQDYPIANRENKFVIGIFGGSVAENFASNSRINELFTEKFKSRFKQIKRDILIANMALGGGKQPQQFIINSYFLEMFDLVINIDGFNEILLSRGGHTIHPEDYPYDSELLFPQNQSIKSRLPIKILGKILLYRTLLSVPSERLLKTNILSRSSAIYILWNSYNKTLTSLINHEYQEIKKCTPSKAVFNNEIGPEASINTWKRYSLLQATILKSKMIPYIFFIQPNIHFKGSKIISEKEKINAFRKDLSPHLNTHYKSLHERMYELQKLKVNSYSLANIFKNNKETLYTDICHLNIKGDRIMANKIVDFIEKYKILDTYKRHELPHH